MNRLAKIVRMLTIPPVLALLLLISLWIYHPALFGGGIQFSMMAFFLVAMPALAYPIQPLIPAFRDKGRDGQRTLAFITSVIGYLCGVLFAALTRAPIMVHVICWSYLLSVALLTLVNKATPFRASGHACGVAGPICLMVYVFGPKALPMALLFLLMAWASVKMCRHTLMELLLGGLDSVVATLLVLCATRALA